MISTDDKILMALLLEAIVLGIGDIRAAFEWAEEQGYVELVEDQDGDAWIALLDEGRRHVGSQVVIPEWN